MALLKPYDHGNYPQNGALGSSQALRTELDAIETAFDILDAALDEGLTGAAGSATIAAAQAAIATTQAGISTTQAGIATTKASEASTSASNANTSKLAAQSAQAAAEAARDSALSAYDNFDDRYLGPKASDPTTDNDGDPLEAGALYFNTVSEKMRLYTGSIWVAAYVTGVASEIENIPSGNLSATNIQAALNELQGDIDTREKSINSAAAKTSLVDADSLGLIDSEASSVLKKITWANIKLVLKNYFDTLYASISALALKADVDSPSFTGLPTAPTASPGTNTDQIATCAFALSNASPSFDSGTRLAFNQSSAPTGWTKDTNATLNDSIMRIVTGAVGAGGATAFSTFNAQTSVGATTLSLAQIPSHSHGVSLPVGTVAGAGVVQSSGSQSTTYTTSTGAQGGGGSHTHTITTGIKYNDFIIAQKD